MTISLSQIFSGVAISAIDTTQGQSFSGLMA